MELQEPARLGIYTNFVKVVLSPFFMPIALLNLGEIRDRSRRSMRLLFMPMSLRTLARSEQVQTSFNESYNLGGFHRECREN